MSSSLSVRVGLASLLCLSLAHAGCADPGGPPPRDTGPVRDGGDARPLDAPMTMDVLMSDDVPTSDTPPVIVGTCATCETNDDCEGGSYCAMLVTGGRACLPGCDADLPDCPRMFSCIFDATGTGVDATICAPVGGPCCVDEDGDGYGNGVGCMDVDCDDADPEIHPGRTEICDGVDTNCNRTVDEPPVDCESGVCSVDVDGTYDSLSGGVCATGACTSGTVTDCLLYTCEGGGEMGATCATSCDGSGADDDLFCIDVAHCDGGACAMDVDNGQACDEDSDCTSTHCDNGFCCGSGTCCGTNPDCPGFPGAGTLCTEPIDCQGTRGSISCDPATFECQIVSGVADDRACDMTVVADECGLFSDLTCTGAADQPRPRCPSSCTRDDQCDGAAHCDLSTCFPDLPDGNVCDEDSDCGSGHCSNGFCCATGDCCRNAADCPATYATAPVCDDDRGCQGTRDVAACTANVCTTTADVPDDSACDPGVVADVCGLYPSVRCTGAVMQMTPICPASCSGDSDCDDPAHCDGGLCVPDVVNGGGCDEASDCVSANCTNRYCCGAGGSCCVTDTDCPGFPGTGIVCTEPIDCQGESGSISCDVANFMCETTSGVPDDSACTTMTLADTCGYFADIRCSGAADQPRPRCPTSCTTDAECDASAHCDLGACFPDSPPGAVCDEPSDCAGGYCGNGYCCDGGDCCSVASNCPSSYGSTPVCDDFRGCQGTRNAPACVANRCTTTSGVGDDSACTTATIADTCGLYPTVYCTGAVTQTAPSCAMTCAVDGECDATAHCDGFVCVPDLPNGSGCDEGSDCTGGYCGNGFCCASGDCCAASPDCPGYPGVAPACATPSICQGTRTNVSCNTSTNQCVVASGVGDDSACTSSVVANTCGLFTDLRCTGAVDQPIPSCDTSCTLDSECDASAHCDLGTCVPDSTSGTACDEASDCITGYCGNGFCCGGGDCCSIAANCPASYSNAPTCDTSATCQGTRDNATCTANVCGTTTNVPDDSACTAGTVANTCGVYPSVTCNGMVVQNTPACPSTCSNDSGCDAAAHCDASACVDDVADGGACDEASDCEAGYCNNGFCCSSGTCCSRASDCPGSFSTAPMCTMAATCQGTRSDAVCDATFHCGTMTGVGDDSACTSSTIASTCGFYVDVACSGAPNQTAPTCATSCTVDSQCDGNAHCDGGACVADLPGGSVCDETSDCVSNYCGNGFCCASGDCCSTASNCPASYSSAPACVTPSACQGTRDNATCVANQCGTSVDVPDDSACTSSTVANTCGTYPTIFCNGAVTQSAPMCATTCTGDPMCDTNAFCSGGACVPDLPGGNPCTLPTDCATGHCQNGYCCTSGDCCSVAANCPASYSSAAICETPSACQGSRDDATCVSNICGTTVNVPDDSACTAAVVANTCSLYPTVTCTGAANQTAPMCAMTCSNDSGCDANAHCDGGMCIADQGGGTMCDEASDCTSGYCGNGYCCASGDCCSVAANCPASYSSASTCTNPATCQGTRSDATCSAAFQCGTTTGVADDSGCTSGTVANMCGPYPNVNCNGMASQSTPSCASSCTMDGDCDANAHCDGTCVLDAGNGTTCDENSDCTSNSCVDGVCCNTSCTGSCAACNLAGSVGTCTNVPNGSDPASECGGFSCDAYFAGFTGDNCFDRSDAPDSAVFCNGAGACQNAATVCPARPAGDLRLTCNALCQDPTASTCTGTTPGACTNVNPGNTSCGSGRCLVTVPTCVGGMMNTCTPASGMAIPETCNNIDDNCNTVVDDPPTAANACMLTNVTTNTCVGGVCGIGACTPGFESLDGNAANGCECATNVGSTLCSTATTIGDGVITVGESASISGNVSTGDRWFVVSFPQSTRPGAGTAHIAFTAGAATHNMFIARSCSGDTISCSMEGGSSGVADSFDFLDNASAAGSGAYSTNSVAWPTQVYIRVRRDAPTTMCSAAAFTITITR